MRTLSAEHSFERHTNYLSIPFSIFLEDCLIEKQRYPIVFSNELHTSICDIARVRQLVLKPTSSKSTLPNFFFCLDGGNPTLIRSSRRNTHTHTNASRQSRRGGDQQRSSCLNKIGGLLHWHLFSFSLLILSPSVFFSSCQLLVFVVEIGLPTKQFLSLASFCFTVE